jgi:hypothetical protein
MQFLENFQDNWQEEYCFIKNYSGSFLNIALQPGLVP